MTRASAIKQGDIVRIALDPTAGSELRGTRPVLVLSNAEFNRVGRALIAPITQCGNIGRIDGWAVTLMGAGTVTQGVVVVSHCRVVDLAARGAKLIEVLPASIVEELRAKLQAMVESAIPSSSFILVMCVSCAACQQPCAVWTMFFTPQRSKVPSCEFHPCAGH